MRLTESVSGIQGLHRLGALGYGGQSPVPACPPERRSYLRPASEIPQEPAPVLPHPQQGKLCIVVFSL